jgi:hypothetical protein
VHAEGWRLLFSLYVHPPPNFSFQPGSIFYGREVGERVPVEWGQWSVVSLLAQMLGDPSQRPARNLLLVPCFCQADFILSGDFYGRRPSSNLETCAINCHSLHTWTSGSGMGLRPQPHFCRANCGTAGAATTFADRAQAVEAGD